jgi:uncharacterized protein (UPF0335 family)
MSQNADINGGDNAHRVAADQLRSFCERLERLAEEKAAIAEDMKQVRGEAKAMGYDLRTLNEMLKLRAMEAHERMERELIRDTYAKALGVFG